MNEIYKKMFGIFLDPTIIQIFINKFLMVTVHLKQVLKCLYFCLKIEKLMKKGVFLLKEILQ